MNVLFASVGLCMLTLAHNILLAFHISNPSPCAHLRYQAAQHPCWSSRGYQHTKHDRQLHAAQNDRH